ncbi:hypothetical protein [Deinococcus marmoris]|uniref:hypothetical protein n=1 Tax=Deinococcus marmoris TaxID=249408 RepID=UPI0004978F89|nr:hypothetical protein [Deinococcus marmoris]
MALGLTALLAACTNTTTPATVSSIQVTGTSSIVIGQTKTLSAVAKDAGGNVLSGRAVTWTSSAPELISVDASGKITAHHFSLEEAKKTVTITASSDGKTGTVAVLPHGFDFSCGTYTYSTDSETVPFFAMYTRFRAPDGGNIEANTDYEVVGPGGFNEGKAYRGMVFQSTSAGSGYGGPRAVAGTYSASLRVAGVNYTDTCTVDPKVVLGNISTPTVTVTGNKASYSGTAPANTKLVYASVENDTSDHTTSSKLLASPTFSLQDELTPTAPSGTYNAWIYARNFGTTLPMPDVVLMSATYVSVLKIP